MSLSEEILMPNPVSPTIDPPITGGSEAQMLGKDRWEQVRALHEVGITVSEIGRRLSLDRKTVRRCLSMGEWQPYRREVKPETLLDTWRPWLEARVIEVGYSAQILFQELRAKGFAGSYETVKRFVAPLRVLADRAALCQTRFETAPGEQAQVDYGQIRVQFRAQPAKVHLFVMTLGYSRRGFYSDSGNEQMGTFLEAHERAFDHFGGLCRTMLYDRPRIVWETGREGKPGHWNPTFWRFSEHWGFEPRLCAAYRAQTKGKVESGVRYVKCNFVLGRSFVDIVDFGEQLQQWQSGIADTRIHGTVHQRPIERFATEQSALISIQGHRPFGDCLAVSRIVADDYLVSFDTNRYSVPFHLISKPVTVQTDAGELVIRHQDREVARHPVLAGKHQMRILPEHGPGALARNRRQRIAQPEVRLLNRWFGPPEVEVRDLAAYEQVSA